MRQITLAIVFLACGMGDRCSGAQEAEVGRKLEIVSAPSGAAVKVDGVAKGNTPLTLENLDVVEGQEQVLIFELEGYLPQEKTVTWSSAEQSISATLEKAVTEHVITVKSSPKDAKVYADGDYKGETPCTWSVEAEDGAEMNLLVQKKGYADISETIVYGDDKTMTFEYKFLKSGKLNLAELDRVLLKQEKRWRKACKTISSDVCKFKYKVDEEGRVTKVSSVQCSDPSINACTKKQVKKMKFPAAEKGRNDNFTWYGM